MTLVVARVSGKRVAVASDTLLTQHDVPLPISQGVVKTYMLPGGICASFANSPELAMKDFEEFMQVYPKGTGFSEGVSFFEKASFNSGNDYLIAFAQHAKLVKIVDGKRISGEAKTQWIGDSAAYQRFREYELKKRKFMEAGHAINAVIFADEIEKSPASDLFSTMRQVVSDKQISTVGGFVYVLSDRLEAFRQSAYCDMLYNWPSTAPEDFILDLNDQIDFGASGENYNFAVAQASPSYLNLNIAVFYFLTAQKLFIFAGQKNDPLMRCTVLSDVEPLTINARLNAHFGQDFRWLIQVMSAAPSEASTQFRKMPITSGPNGVRFSMLCHVNTFPKTTAIK